MTVRLRFALLYCGALLISGLVVLSLAFASTERVQHVGGGPVRTSHASVYTNASALEVIIALAGLMLPLLATSTAEDRLGRPVQATIRDPAWLDSGTGAFHDTVTSRPLLELALAPDLAEPLRR